MKYILTLAALASNMALGTTTIKNFTHEPVTISFYKAGLMPSQREIMPRSELTLHFENVTIDIVPKGWVS